MKNREEGQRNSAPGTLLQRIIASAERRSADIANQMMTAEIMKCRDTYHVAL